MESNKDLEEFVDFWGEEDGIKYYCQYLKVKAQNEKRTKEERANWEDYQNKIRYEI